MRWRAARCSLTPACLFVRAGGGGSGARRLSPAAKDRSRLVLVAVRHQPALGLGVQIGEHRAGGDHHPHCRLFVGARLRLPLALTDQKRAQRRWVALAQDGVEPLPEAARLIIVLSTHGNNLPLGIVTSRVEHAPLDPARATKASGEARERKHGEGAPHRAPSVSEWWCAGERGAPRRSLHLAPPPEMQPPARDTLPHAAHRATRRRRDSPLRRPAPPLRLRRAARR